MLDARSITIHLRNVIVALALILAVEVGNGARAATYNLASDWSTTNNPNAPWALRADDVNLAAVGDPAGVGEQSWWPGPMTDNKFLPVWFKATHPQFNWVADDVVAHTPDPANGHRYTNTNVLFTAPVPGIANISGVLWNARWTTTEDRTGRWELYVNDVLQDSGLLSAVARSNPETFSLVNVVLGAGNTVRLSLFRNAPDAFHGDFIGTNVTVELSAVPLPAALPLFASGLGVMGLLTWRRKRRMTKAAAA